MAAKEPQGYLKAIVAGVAAGLGVAIGAATDSVFTLAEGLTVAGAALGTFQATYWTTNKP